MAAKRIRQCGIALLIVLLLPALFSPMDSASTSPLPASESVPAALSPDQPEEQISPPVSHPEPAETEVPPPEQTEPAAVEVLPPEQAEPAAEEVLPSEQPEPAAVAEWNLILVNPWNPIPEGYAPELKKVTKKHSVDQRCYDDLMAMLEGCRDAGHTPILCSAYRTQEYQEGLFENKVRRLIKQGYAEEEARSEAATAVAFPGTSEHQLGLAVDIVDKSNQKLNRSQEDTEVQQWLMAHSWEYGFILRYPNEKSDMTGIIYEPWHYRYVGKEHAKAIYDSGLCLEEYLQQLTAEE